MLIILVFGMMRQKDNCECEASLDYRVRFLSQKGKEMDEKLERGRKGGREGERERVRRE